MPIFTAKQKVWIASRLYRVIATARSIAGCSPETRVRRRGLHWQLDLREGIDFSIFLLGAFEPSTLRAYTALLRPGAVIFDIGANIGAHTLHFARLAGPNGRVYAFEPTDFAFTKLKRNIALNPELAPRILPVQAFLVDRADALAPITVSSSWPIDVAAKAGNEHGGQPQALNNAVALTADQFCQQHGIAHIDLVKIDVDGNELTVLRGFEETLRRLRPRILMEFAPFVYARPEDFTELIQRLDALGYRIQTEDGRHDLPSEPALLLRRIPHGAIVNALLTPRH